MKTFDERIKLILKAIVNSESCTSYMRALRLRVKKEGGLPLSHNKEKMIEDITTLLNDKPLENYAHDLLAMMLCRETKVLKFTDSQKEQLSALVRFLKETEYKRCEHHNLGIGVFMHGGGFMPTHNLPELICIDCGLNITLGKKFEYLESDIGLSMDEKSYESLHAWAYSLFGGKGKTEYAEVITKNPIEAYKRSPKWDGDLPTITDRAKLEASSGR